MKLMIPLRSYIDIQTLKKHALILVKLYEAQSVQDVLYCFIYQVMVLRKLMKQLKMKIRTRFATSVPKNAKEHLSCQGIFLFKPQFSDAQPILGQCSSYSSAFSMIPQQQSVEQLKALRHSPKWGHIQILKTSENN